MFVLEPFKLLFKYRSMLKQTTLNEIKARYAGSLLGLLWFLIYPLLFLSAYAGVFIYVFNVRFQMFNTNEYVVLIFCGLIPFLSFTEALSNGVGSVVSNANLMKNTLFPIELVPVKAVLISQTIQVTGSILLLIALGLLNKLCFWTPYFILIWVLQIMFSIGVVWIISSINVMIRDLQNIISIIILLLMMVSPISYPANMVPDNLKPFLSLNPIYYFITAYQHVLMLGDFPPIDIFLNVFFISIFTFYIGFWFFTKMKKVFADNV